jgi:hypothetical protein
MRTRMRTKATMGTTVRRWRGGVYYGLMRGKRRDDEVRMDPMRIEGEESGCREIIGSGGEGMEVDVKM